MIGRSINKLTLKVMNIHYWGSRKAKSTGDEVQIIKKEG
jgi:hypothetical protein